MTMNTHTQRTVVGALEKGRALSQTAGPSPLVSCLQVTFPAHMKSAREGTRETLVFRVHSLSF